MILELKEITKVYGNHLIIDGLTLTIEKPEIFGLLGPSGSGKTTLVKMIAGIETPTAGTIHVFGEKMPKLKVMAKFGYMAQSDALYGELTAKENIEFFAGLYGMRGKPLKSRMNQVMDAVGLIDELNKQVGQFSGGMKRRLSLAIAMMHEPKLLILDEPTVGIDPILRKNIWDMFKDLKAGGTGVIVTTHVMDEADKCDRLGMIRNGKMIAIGEPDALKKETETSSIEEAFLAFGGAVREK